MQRTGSIRDPWVEALAEHEGAKGKPRKLGGSQVMAQGSPGRVNHGPHVPECNRGHQNRRTHGVEPWRSLGGPRGCPGEAKGSPRGPKGTQGTPQAFETLPCAIESYASFSTLTFWDTCCHKWSYQLRVEHTSDDLQIIDPCSGGAQVVLRWRSAGAHGGPSRSPMVPGG